ncbi:MAG: aminotransferase class V-fold PLP-dependent enzyme [Calditrichaeota bacterium]|nr:MAG: aminotransferase class V-fold PLP-dependent enzyme [Calditrichota bacterium]
MQGKQKLKTQRAWKTTVMNQNTDFADYFPHSSEQTYLNHAAVSPLPRPTVEALRWYLDQRSGQNIEFWPQALEVRQQFKMKVAALINARPEDIAWTPNTSSGLNILANGLSWQPGDRILLNSMEFPANVYPFLNLERLGVAVDFVVPREGRLLLEDFEHAITPRTRLLSISFVQFLNGFRSDLKALAELCHRHGLIFCVDAIQGLGALQMDVQAMGIDFLACSGHKWLMWPLGTGFVYIAPHLLERLHPAVVGWFSVQGSERFLDYRLEFLPHAGRFETGTFNTAGLVGANASLDMMLEIGPQAIEQRVLHLSSLLIDACRRIGLELFTVPDLQHRSGIVTFRHPRAGELFEALARERIHVSLREGMIRVAPHFYNTEADIQRLMEAVNRFNRRNGTA